MFRPMNPPRRIMILFLPAIVALSITGCSSSEETEPVVLLDCNFRGGAADPALGTTFGLHDGLHVFGDGWANYPSDEGVWTLGDEAVIDATLMGSSVGIEIGCSTNPDLSARGQQLTILVNGHEIGSVDLADGWETVICGGVVPDETLHRGENRITLRSAVHRAAGEHEDRRPLAVFVRHIRIRAELTESERREWSGLTALPETPDAWRRRTMEGPSGTPAIDGLPDVLVILIDAAHAAHLHCYGYHRETTPCIDELASASLRLTKVIAPSPFTIVSVPSLLTGLPWRDHLVHENKDALAPSFVTLAEILHDHGYFTLGMSDNPYVSKATGSDQGFEVFDEIWKHPRHGGPGNTPELIEEVFAEYCDAKLDERPFFTYLHLMPPHTPYVPGPEHDLWGDATFDGDIDGGSDQLTAFNDGRRKFTAAEHDRLVSLYDGNLHRIDASVGRILDTWRARDRGRELLVVFVSDHGEAFGQHGKYEHLTTVYDEMVHVPLMLWPATAWEHLAASTDDLYTLADVTPLLLQKLGLAPPVGLPVTGRFATLLENPTAPRSEVLIRTATAHHTLGLRTPGHLLVYDGFRRQELFDLERDPGATRNLRLENADLYRQLLGRMRSILLERDEAAVAGASQLTEEDRRTLKSLGY